MALEATSTPALPVAGRLVTGQLRSTCNALPRFVFLGNNPLPRREERLSDPRPCAPSFDVPCRPRGPARRVPTVARAHRAVCFRLWIPVDQARCLLSPGRERRRSAPEHLPSCLPSGCLTLTGPLPDRGTSSGPWGPSVHAPLLAGVLRLRDAPCELASLRACAETHGLARPLPLLGKPPERLPSTLGLSRTRSPERPVRDPPPVRTPLARRTRTACSVLFLAAGAAWLRSERAPISGIIPCGRCPPSKRALPPAPEGAGVHTDSIVGVRCRSNGPSQRSASPCPRPKPRVRQGCPAFSPASKSTGSDQGASATWSATEAAFRRMARLTSPLARFMGSPGLTAPCLALARRAAGTHQTDVCNPPFWFSRTGGSATYGSHGRASSPAHRRADPVHPEGLRSGP